MTAKMTKKLPSKKLENLFEQINSTFGQAKKLVLEAYNLAIQEKYTPQGAKQLLLDKITVFKKTQIYAYLPPECKNPIKQKAGSVSHKEEVSVPKSEQNNVTSVKADSVSQSNSQASRDDNYLVALQSENATLKREIENISNNIIPESMLKKDRQIGELQRDKENLEQAFKKEVEQLKSGELSDSSASSFVEKKARAPEPQQIKKPVPELTNKTSPKVYYKELPLLGNVTLHFKCISIPRMLNVSWKLTRK
jgi:hypothetical protein